MKKAFISFDLNSINVSGKKEDNFEPIKTQPNEAGSDPNINSVIKFNVKNSNEIFNKFQNENIQLERMNSQNYE